MGRSNGDRGFVHRFEDYVDDFLLLVQQTKARWKGLPSIAIGVAVCLEAAKYNYRLAVLDALVWMDGKTFLRHQI